LAEIHKHLLPTDTEQTHAAVDAAAAAIMTTTTTTIID
jgi:hypothetical protein